MGALQSGTGQQMLAGRKNISSSGKQYKRGQGSLGPNPSSGQGLRPGTAQKRPASPNT